MSLTYQLMELDEIRVIQVNGNILSDLDFSELELEIDNIIELGFPNLILDLQNVAVINSLGVKSLIKTFTKCRNAGGEMYIVNISDKINHVLMLTKLNAVLNIAPSVKEAEQNILKGNES